MSGSNLPPGVLPGDIPGNRPGEDDDLKTLERDNEELRQKNARLRAKCAEKDAVIATILDDATGDAENADKRVWPIRVENYRKAKAALTTDGSRVGRLVESLKECQAVAAAAFRVTATFHVGDELIAEMKRVGVREGFGTRANAALAAYEEKKDGEGVS